MILNNVLKLMPQNLLADALGLLAEVAIVAAVGWHYGAAHVQSKWDVAKAAQVSVDAAANQKNRKLEQDLADAKQEIEDVKQTAKAEIASTTVALHADADRVRSQLSLALDKRGSTEDTLAACQQRSASAGKLLGDGLQVQVDLASGAESLLADAYAVRAFATKVKAAASAPQ